MATVKFSDEMPKPTSIKGTDRFLISDGVTGEAKAPDFNQAKEYLNITGIEMEPLVGGTTSGTALVVPNGPAGEQRTAEVSSGKWYDFGSGPVEASADRRWKAYWSGTAWSLKDMGALPTSPPTPVNGVVAPGNKNAVPGEEVYNKATLKTHGRNYINKSTLKDGYYINEANGLIQPHSSYAATEEFIELVPNASYTANRITRYAYYSAPTQSAYISGAVPNYMVPTEFMTPNVPKLYIRLAVGISSAIKDVAYLGLTSEYDGYVAYEKLMEPGVKAQAVTEDVKEDILEKAPSVVGEYGKNRIDNNALIQGKFVNAFTGELNNNANYKATDFCYVGDLETYTVSPIIRHLAKYAEPNEASYLSGVENPGGNTVTRGQEKWVRLSFLNAETNLQLEGGDVATSYEPFVQSISIEQQGRKYAVEMKAGAKAVNSPMVALPTNIYLAPNIQYNLYFSNFFVTDYRFNDLDIFEAVANQGQFLTRQYRLTGNEIGTIPLTLKAFSNGAEMIGKSVVINIAAATSGNGNIRKVLYIGDSLVNSGHILKRMKDFSDTDVMDLVFIGTRTSQGILHEGIGGATIEDHYGTGRITYRFNVSGITTNPTSGDIYTTNGSSYRVSEINIASGSGYFSCTRTSGTNDPVLSGGVLTKSSGGGQSSYSYDTAQVINGSRFHNPSTGKFDLGYYLAQTGQSLSANDWIFFNLGINDLFGVALEKTTDWANAKIATMKSQLRYMVDNIKAYNPDIRIGINLTPPPACNQDATGILNNSARYSREAYVKLGLKKWWETLIAEFQSIGKVYLVPVNALIDTENNFPITARHTFFATAISVAPVAGAVYQYLGSNYTLTEAKGNELTFTGPNRPLRSGVLTKVSGTGDTSISFSESLSSATTNIDQYSNTKAPFQNNDVHPDIAGYYQMADANIGIIKYFG